jgi:uncharacterized tellurite resistance protein B-like protein
MAMLKALRTFIDSLSGGEEPRRFAETDHRLAAAALLVHLIAVDGKVTDSERDRLSAVLGRQFELDEGEAEELISAARRRDVEAVDLYGFTSVLKRSLDETGRQRVVEMMWEMVFADGAVSEFEDNLIWRVAELLGVSTRDRIRLRKQVEAGWEPPS